MANALDEDEQIRASRNSAISHSQRVHQHVEIVSEIITIISLLVIV
jgi:hypothetical protein